jgi:hypothetical protein
MWRVCLAFVVGKRDQESANLLLDRVKQVTDEHIPKQHRKLLIDAAAIVAYHAETGYAVVRTLICDDAPQFNWLARMMMQCWVHEGRHYKKLSPVVAVHRAMLDDFLKRFWAYYHQLLAYRQEPNADERQRLEGEFDRLFTANTGYDELDKRIARTKTKKAIAQKSL